MSEGQARLGSALVAAGALLLAITFLLAYFEYSSIRPAETLEATIRLLVWAVVKAVFLGIMGWVGSIFLSRGLEVQRGRGEEVGRG